MIISSLICPTAIQSEIIFTTPQKYFKFFVTSIFKILEILRIYHRESSNSATDHRWPEVTKEVQKISCKIEPSTDRQIIWRRSSSWLSVIYLFVFGLGLGLVLILEFFFGSWKNGQNGRLRTKAWVSLDNKEVKYISFKLYWFIRENRDDDWTITVKKRRLVAKKNLYFEKKTDCLTRTIWVHRFLFFRRSLFFLLGKFSLVKFRWLVSCLIN